MSSPSSCHQSEVVGSSEMGTMESDNLSTAAGNSATRGAEAEEEEEAEREAKAEGEAGAGAVASTPG
jgi:hypothetical protein